MTTDTELRDLLTSAAGGPAAGGGWDDVVRRGRHRQRVRRAQVSALAVLAVGAVVTGIALSADDPTVDTTPATDPTSPSTTEGTAPSISTTTVPIPDDGRPHVQAGRAQGVFLTVIIPWADPSTGFDPCVDLHPRVVESRDQVGIELETEDAERGLPWADCQSSPFSARGLIELLEPVDDRPVVDLTTGNAVFLADGGSLLFPTELPAPFDIERWDEFTAQGSWMFSWSADDLYVNVTTGYGGTDECDREAIEVRSTQGRLCRGDDGHFDLHWEESGQTIAIEIGNLGEGSAPFTVEDVLAIAEGLEPLGG